MTATTAARSADYLVTACDAHGTTGTTDPTSQSAYVRVARLCHKHGTEAAHTNAHYHNGTSCFGCCDQMRVAVLGELRA